MKRAILYAFFGASFLVRAVDGMNTISIWFDCSPDDHDARLQIWQAKQNTGEIAAAQNEGWTFCHVLQRIGEGGFDILFGNASNEYSFLDLAKRPPSGYAIPVFENPQFRIGGRGYAGNFQSRFYAISDVGGILTLPFGDGKQLSAVFLYFKVDDKFVPVRSVADYRARMDWDRAKLNRLKSWVETRAKEKGFDLYSYNLKP